ncbi:SpoIIIAH-like family protein [uncultured Ruminococcus sp.]|uniref:SpoIIIAH-like family protein n=1 Tax=uncultured Ruminococcus sp. TaxID=165186 RepID=UPI0025EBCE3A|nr:SpoIIIAH-like family protein [uncultured Ruminococcus sp.]
MKKPSIIIGKKQIIMTCLTLMLAVAVYINYATAPELGRENGSAVFHDRADDVKYGETEFVNAEAEPMAGDYFAQARLDKMKDRDEAVQTLQTMIGGGDVTKDEAIVNALDAVQVSKLIESEGTIESLIKAQGFQDCVAYLDGENAKVVVKTEGLDKAQAAFIKEIILGETSVAAENIRIFEVK